MPVIVFDLRKKNAIIFYAESAKSMVLMGMVLFNAQLTYANVLFYSGNGNLSKTYNKHLYSDKLYM